MKTSISRTRKIASTRIAVIVAALALALAILPLAACSSEPAPEDTSAAGTTEQAIDAAPAAEPAAAPVDTSSWKTLGDALSTATEAPSASWNDKFYVCMFTAGSSKIYAVGKVDSSIDGKLADLDMGDADYSKKLAKTLADYELVSAEDVTADELSQEALNALVGKTGQELMDEGFAFDNYFMYGGEQTGATMEKGYFSYNFTFDTTVAEDKTEDDGAAIKGAKVTEAEVAGFGNAALDPEKIK